MRFKEGVDYRVIPKAERNGYKYELLKSHVFWNIDLGSEYLIIKDYVHYSPLSHSLVLYKGYRWNGSNVVRDTAACMRASAVHDAICQLINEGKLDKSYRKYADQLYRKMMIEDGAWRWHAWFIRYAGLRLWAATKWTWAGLKRIWIR